jgi:ankyrin repeat protein
MTDVFNGPQGSPMIASRRIELALLSIFAMSLLSIVPAGLTEAASGNPPASKQELFEAVDRWDRQQTLDVLHRGADVNARDDEGYAALHRACAAGNLSIVEILLDAGADVNARTAAGETPLHVAASKEIALRLVAKGADVNARDSELGMTPLFNADTAISDFLIARGADVNARSANGMTPLIWACYGGGAEKVRLLLKRGAGVNAGAGSTKTALHVAANWGHVEVTAVLLEAGADPNARDGLGWTPLHWAALEGGPEVSEMLIKNGADLTARTAKAWSIIPAGSTPLDVATRAGSGTSFRSLSPR